MSVLGQRLLAVHEALTRAQLPHAFGGAIALAYCTEEPRGTRDLDVNIFSEPHNAAEVLRALPDEVTVRPMDVEAARREGQVRLWWEDTPIDVFLNVHELHEQFAGEVRWVSFEDHTIPVLGCTALIVFKALFNRTKDWADIEAIVESDAGDVPLAIQWLKGLLGPSDHITQRLTSLVE
ncbi:MAG TPA: hypothetical protein VFV03_02155 [Solirubrobacteraceae bacterium]|nr:hypothetical protein [Solirubrobacteraceae bacterium]